MKKQKVLAGLLAGVLALSSCVPVWAIEDESVNPEQSVATTEESGEVVDEYVPAEADTIAEDQKNEEVSNDNNGVEEKAGDFSNGEEMIPVPMVDDDDGLPSEENGDSDLADTLVAAEELSQDIPDAVLYDEQFEDDTVFSAADIQFLEFNDNKNRIEKNEQGYANSFIFSDETYTVSLEDTELSKAFPDNVPSTLTEGDIKWSVGCWNYESDEIDQTIVSDGFEISDDGKSVILDGNKLYASLSPYWDDKDYGFNSHGVDIQADISESGDAQFTANLYVDVRAVQLVNDTPWDRIQGYQILSDGQEEFNLSKKLHWRIQNSTYPDGEDVYTDLKIEVQGVYEYDEKNDAFSELTDQNNWDKVFTYDETEHDHCIKGISDGKVTFKIKYNVPGEDEDKFVYADEGRDFELYICGAKYELNTHYPNNTDCMLPGSSIVVETDLEKKIANDEDEQIEEYSLIVENDQGQPRYDDEVLDVKIITGDNGYPAFEVTASSNVPEDEDYYEIDFTVEINDDGNVINQERTLGVHIRQDVYYFDPSEIDEDDNIQVGGVFTVEDNIDVKHVYKTGSSTIDANLEIRDFDRNVFKVKKEEDGKVLSVERTSSRDGWVKVIATFTNALNFEESIENDYWFDGIDYGFWFDPSYGDEETNVLFDKEPLLLKIKMENDSPAFPEGTTIQAMVYDEELVGTVTVAPSVNATENMQFVVNADLQNEDDYGCAIIVFQAIHNGEVIAEEEYELETRFPEYYLLDEDVTYLIPGMPLEYSEKMITLNAFDADHWKDEGQEIPIPIREITGDPANYIKFEEADDSCWQLTVLPAGIGGDGVKVSWIMDVSDLVDADKKSVKNYANQRDDSSLDNSEDVLTHTHTIEIGSIYHRFRTWLDGDSNMLCKGQTKKLNVEIFVGEYYDSDGDGDKETVWRRADSDEYELLFEPDDPTLFSVDDQRMVSILQNVNEEVWDDWEKHEIRITATFAEETPPIEATNSMEVMLTHDYYELHVDPIVLEPGESTSIDNIHHKAVHYKDSIPEGVSEDADFDDAFFTDDYISDELMLSEDGESITLDEDIEPEQYDEEDYPLYELAAISVRRNHLGEENFPIDGMLMITVCKHEWDGGTVTKSASCKATGILTKTCKKGCGETLEEVIPLAAHTLTHVAPTETTIEYWTCSVCGKHFSDAAGRTEITNAQINAANSAKAADVAARKAAAEEAARKAAEEAAQPDVTIPKAPAISKVKPNSKRKVTVNLKKFKKNKKTKKIWNQIKKIIIEYSTDPSFPKDNTGRKVVGKNKTKVALTGLEKGTKYYVRAKYWDGTGDGISSGGVSAWSGTKNGKTKKK